MSHPTKTIVKNHYRQIASNSGCGCGCSGAGQSDNQKIAASIGYSSDEIESAGDANLGLGCGNPTAVANLKPGETVLDLGSGAGFDCFLAAQKVGPTGLVIGVDMTAEMIAKAQVNASKYGYNNVEFRLGDIENLPIDDDSIDVIISNCVINLAPDKAKVFSEAYRVLKTGGRMYVSDIVLLKPLTAEQKKDPQLIAGCVGGALLRDEYLELIKTVGFTTKVLSEDKDISKRQYNGIALESLKVEAVK